MHWKEFITVQIRGRKLTANCFGLFNWTIFPRTPSPRWYVPTGKTFLNFQMWWLNWQNLSKFALTSIICIHPEPTLKLSSILFVVLLLFKSSDSSTVTNHLHKWSWAGHLTWVIYMGKDKLEVTWKWWFQGNIVLNYMWMFRINFLE